MKSSTGKISSLKGKKLIYHLLLHFNFSIILEGEVKDFIFCIAFLLWEEFQYCCLSGKEQRWLLPYVKVSWPGILMFWPDFTDCWWVGNQKFHFSVRGFYILKCLTGLTSSSFPAPSWFETAKYYKRFWQVGCIFPSKPCMCIKHTVNL